LSKVQFVARESHAAARNVDPVTFEVIRHRLMGITTEQAARLVTTSGSKHVTEMSDYNVGLYLPDGSVAAMGRTILYHSSSMAAMVRAIIEDCSENPGIAPGDMFIVNDPWKGSLHAPDMAIVTPIHFDGRLIMWAGAMMHMSDIGGMSEGSVMLASTDTYQEGLLIPPTKLIDAGTLREDVWRLVIGNCRHPATMSLDLKGLISANSAAVEGLDKLVRRYGAETLLDVMSALIAASESRLRERLRRLPDATVVASAYLEYDESLGDVPEVQLELRKSGDTLTFDYSNSSAQVPNSMNCTHGGLMAGISAALLPTLAYDIPWNEGLYRAIDVICPEGRICNARKPAAVSGNISGAVWEVEMTATVGLSRLAACSDKFLNEAQASPCGRPGSLALFGVNQHGERFFGRTYDVLGSGGAAYAHHDGVSTHGHHSIERTLVSNVESLELDLPILYLRRAWARDSGGAGRQRGGLSILGVYKPHKVASTFQRVGVQWKVPDAIGAFGGYPGSEMGSDLLRSSDVNAVFDAGHVPEFEELRGTPGVPPATLPQFSVTRLETDDVVRANPPAGAGWGDPLDRPIEEVQEDLTDGATSQLAAERLYGCIVDDGGKIDADATRRNRENIRRERMSWPRRKLLAAQPVGALVRVCPMGDQLEIAGDASGAFWTMCKCGHALAAANENWRTYAGVSVAEPGELGIGLLVHQSLEMRRYSCPGCGRLHAVDICRKTSVDPHDIKIAIQHLFRKMRTANP
jgi:N-methylhydantoinase B